MHLVFRHLVPSLQLALANQIHGKIILCLCDRLRGFFVSVFWQRILFSSLFQSNEIHTFVFF